jgi:hypothetical protein
VDAELRLKVDINLDELIAQLARIEENMATKDQVEQAFRDVTAGIGDATASMRTALDNLAGDIDRLSASDVTDAEVTAARNRVVELRAIVDQAASLAARTPEQPTTGGGGTTTGEAT